MAGLTYAELVKRPGRVETFVSKLKEKTPFALTSGGTVISNTLLFDSTTLVIKTDSDVEKAINLLQSTSPKKLAIITNSKEEIIAGKLLKNAEFGGAGGGGGNRGDMAEAIFGAAITSRFISRNKAVVASDVHSILDKINPTKMQQTFSFEGVNKNGKIKDEVIFQLGLAVSNLKALSNPTIRKSLSDIVASALKYANSPTVEAWAKLLYENNQKNKIEIIADGIGDQTGTKVDVRLKVDSQPTNINVSLKAGDVKQFGQVGGTGFDKQKYLWETLLGVDVSSLEKSYNKLLSEKNPTGAIELSYSKAVDLFNKNLKASEKKTLEILSKGVLFFSTLNEENVSLVQLNKSEAKVYQFENLYNALAKSKTKLSAKLITSKSWPEVNIQNEKGEVLLIIRTKGENKPSGEMYIRNYIEKGPLMGTLVASYA